MASTSTETKRKRCAYRPSSPTTAIAISSFSFPKDPEKASIWLTACNREDISNQTVDKLHKNYSLCEKHFERKYISEGTGTRKILFMYAVPTLFKHSINEMGQQHLDESIATSQNINSLSGPSNLLQSEELLSSTSIICKRGRSSSPPSTPVGTQTPYTLSSGTPRKQRLRKKVKSLKRKLALTPKMDEDWNIEDFFKICDAFLSKSLAEIVKEQAVLKDRKPLARRYSMELKQFALTLYFLGPRAYDYMGKLICLSSKRTLQHVTQKLFCKPGVANKEIFEALKIKINRMLPLDKHCAIVIDQMSIKANLFYDTGRDELVGLHDIGKGKREFGFAKNALVIMARGLYSNWKQPIAYFFLKSTFGAKELRVALEECILNLTQIGLSVDALVSDMGSNFIQLSKTLGVSPENSEFELAGMKLIYFFDVYHLIKAVRNVLLQNSLHFDGKKTSWSYVEIFFNQDSKQLYRSAPKLTLSHISPSNFQKMNVNLAVQVLSHTVASGMNTYVSLGGLPSEAIGTIILIEKFNNLFELFNSSFTGEKHKYKKVFEADDFQVKYLEEMIDFIKNFKIFNEKAKDVTARFKFLKCWLITINSLKKLWSRLSVMGFKYIHTKQMNSVCLEIFFGGIRQQGGNNVSPTPVQFARAFKKLVTQNYLQSTGMNCEDDIGTLLVNIENSSIIFAEAENDEPTSAALSLPDYSYRQELLPVQNAFKYVCGYLIKKCLNIHRCMYVSNFQKIVKTCTTQLFTYFKAYDNDKSIYGGLRTPNEQFIHFVYELEKLFIEKFDDFCLATGISRLFFKVMEQIPFNHPCAEFPRIYVVKLFVRLRLFYSLKYANSAIKENTEKTIRKIKILSHE